MISMYDKLQSGEITVQEYIDYREVLYIEDLCKEKIRVTLCVRYLKRMDSSMDEIGESAMICNAIMKKAGFDRWDNCPSTIYPETRLKDAMTKGLYAWDMYILKEFKDRVIEEISKSNVSENNDYKIFIYSITNAYKFE